MTHFNVQYALIYVYNNFSNKKHVENKTWKKASLSWMKTYRKMLNKRYDTEITVVFDGTVRGKSGILKCKKATFTVDILISRKRGR